MRIRRKPSVAFLLASMVSAFSHAGPPPSAIPSKPAIPAANDTAAYHLQSWPPGAAGTLGSSDSAEDKILAAYIHVHVTGFVGWDDSGGMYVGTQPGKFPQLFRVALPGAELKERTFFSKRVATMILNPDPAKKLLLFSQDAGGDEEFSLGLLDLAAGTSRTVNGPPGRAESVIWNDSGTAFAYAHTPKGTDRWDIRVHRLAAHGGNEQDTLVLSRPGTWSPMDFSPDGKSLLVQRYVSASEADIHILDLTRGTLTPLSPTSPSSPSSPKSPPSFADNARFVSGSGRGDRGPGKSRDICFTSDREGEFNRLYLAKAQPPGSDPAFAIEALSPPAAWDVEWVDANPARDLLVYSLNEDGISRIYSVQPGSPHHGSTHLPTSTLLPGMPMGIIDGVHFRVTPGRPPEFAFSVVGATFPGDVFTYRMDQSRATRWTFSETGGIPSRDFRSPQLIRYPTFDSTSSAQPAGPVQPTISAKPAGPVKPRQIPAWVTLPDTAVAHPPFPVLILIHGGPESQARPGFEAFLQYAAGHLGLAVIQPNVRGSSGYGKSYLKADDGYLRMGSVRDIGALLAWIKTRPDLDTNRVAVAGRSYGGFMALSALIEYGRHDGAGAKGQGGGMIRAGISAVGITHFPTFLQKTSGYRRDLRRVEYGDERDPRMAAFLDSISPLTRMDRIGSPLLLCHGRNDPRVPYQESERIFAALKSKGVPVWLLTFEQEGHAFHDQDNLLVHYGIMARFLTKELPLKPATDPADHVRAGRK